MKRILLNYSQLVKFSRSALNTHIPCYSTCDKLKLHTNNIIQYNIRNIHCTLFKASSVNTEKLSPVVEVIYKAPPTTKILKRIRIVTLVIGSMAVAVQPLLLLKAIPVKGATFFGLECVLCFMTIMPYFLHSFSRGYVTEMAYDEANKLYIATLLNFFLKKKYITFKIEDVQPVEETFTSCYVRGRPLILFEESFSDVSHFIKLKGYDKQIDIHLENNSPKSVHSYDMPRGHNSKSRDK